MSQKFPWGTITKVHTIGTHTVTEYVAGPEWSDVGKTEFQACNNSCDTLDYAILLSIASKCGDENAAMYAAKVMGLP